MSLLRADGLSIKRVPARGRKLPDAVAFLESVDLPRKLLVDLALEAQALGVGAEVLLLARGHLGEREYYARLARHLRVEAFGGNVQFAASVPWRKALASGHARLADGRWLVAARGRALTILLQQVSRGRQAGRLVLASPADFEAAILQAFGASIAEDMAHGLPSTRPDSSARDGLNAGQVWSLWTLLLLTAGGFFIWPVLWTALCVGIGAIMLLAVVLRLAAVVASFAPPPQAAACSAADAPFYSILVALHREAAVVPQLIACLQALDYPRHKCEVIFLLESDDWETRNALVQIDMPASFRVVVLPDGLPRTKPRALNLGLLLARGDLLVIYDAEDRPASDQLRKSAGRFQSCNEKTACLQASLAIDNHRDSWLTRLFALDYAAQFDVIMRGFSVLRLPMPLGGTSNHFRIHVLRQVGGWDAWNVTEDADLGLRLARAGYRTQMLDSITWEEAPPTLQNWFPQRCRWMKGWMQTFITQTRQPLRFLRDLGPLHGAHSLALLLSHTFGPLAGIWFTVFVLHDALAGDLLAWQESLFLMAASYFWTGLAGLGLVSIIVPTFVAVARRGLWSCVPWLVLRPLHWLCLSAAALSALVDLRRRPFHWAKTAHGLSKDRARDRA